MFGSLSFIFGLLAQAIGMFQAFEAIQQAGDISPALVAGGRRFESYYPDLKIKELQKSNFVALFIYKHFNKHLKK
jgi:predicted hotdog family 3-hydroxylacyl-ACP dehydratase